MTDILLVPFLFLVKTILVLAVWVVIAEVLINWLFIANIFNTNNRFLIMLTDTLERLTNAMLSPIRRNLPCVVGSLDLSPIILILALTFLENVVIRIIMKLA
ncbi:MAG: YggT family protein [Alphaproteobacteria bacterium]|nr:YggT family protein [Alphaproteobacteria bacterium]